MYVRTCRCSMSHLLPNTTKKVWGMILPGSGKRLVLPFELAMNLSRHHVSRLKLSKSPMSYTSTQASAPR